MVLLSARSRIGGAAATLLAGVAVCAAGANPIGHRVRPGHGTRAAACAPDPATDDSTLPKPPRPRPIDAPDESRRPVRPPSTDADPVTPVTPRAYPPVGAPAADTTATLPVTRFKSDHSAVRTGARQFRALLDQGRVRLLNSDRDRAQIESLCTDGLFQWAAPAPPPVHDDRATPPLDPLAAPSQDGPGDHAGPGPHMIRTGLSSTFGGDATAADAVRGTRAMSFGIATEPPTEFFQMLNSLALHSTSQKPLAITSLLRPPYRTARYTMQSPTNPHALGIAVDIAAFGGHNIVTTDPEEEVQATLALLQALAPGRYRMGLPKAPAPAHAAPPGVPLLDGDGSEPAGSDAGPHGDRARSAGDLPSRGAGRSDSRRALGVLPSRGVARQDRIHERGAPASQLAGSDGQATDAAAAAWPFFPAPQRGADERGRIVTRFANERYAQEQFIADPRIRAALSAARLRGVDVYAVFPDGVNHIHVDVKQVP